MPPRRSSRLNPIGATLILFLASSAHATDSLPYIQRVHSYNAFNTFASGDIRTVGMGGATVGLADTFLAASDNPAGLAMTMNIGDTTLTGNDIHDGNIQDFNDAIATPTAFGAALNHYPWGFSIGNIPMGREGQEYLLPPSAAVQFAGQPASILTESHEMRFSAARVLFNNRLALGASLGFGVGEEEISAPALNGLDDDRHAYAVGATVGAMYQFTGRVLLASSYSLPMHYRIDSSSSPEFPGFFNALDTPSRLSVGLGWIPNRFIRGDFQLSSIGTTGGAALLSNDAIGVGGRPTLQPKLGVAYIFMDLKNVQGTLYGGSYFEFTRIAGARDRFHKTGGLEFKVSVVTAGVGIDTAPQYRNFLYSAGIDVGLVLQDLNLMPTLSRPSHSGTLPNPFVSSDRGLARPLVKDWQSSGPKFNPIQVVSDLPKNVKKEIKHVKERIKAIKTAQ